MESKLLYKKKNKEQIYFSHFNCIKQINIQKWKYNRPADKDRVIEIKNTMLNNILVDDRIYLWQDNTNEYKCYDGNHRLEAIKQILNENKLSKITFPYLQISITQHSDESEIKKKFQMLNKGCPVSELYTENLSNEKIKEIIEWVIDKIKKKWPKHKKTSKNPRIPHFNESNLTQQLYEFLENKNISKEILWNKILELNKIYSEGKHIKLNFSDKIMKKVKDNNCYLFLKKDFTINLDI